MLQDLRYAFRMLIKSKGYTAVAVLALALGIGANTAIFSVADAFLLKPVALPNLENLVVLMERAPHQTANWTRVSPANYLDWQRQSRSFAALSPYEWDDANLTGTGEPERIMIASAAPNFFAVLGAKPMLGRVFLPQDERSSQNQTVVLSYGLWQRRYGADRTIVRPDHQAGWPQPHGRGRHGQEVQFSGEHRNVGPLDHGPAGEPGARAPLLGGPGTAEPRRLDPPSLCQMMTTISRRMAQQYPEQQDQPRLGRTSHSHQVFRDRRPDLPLHTDADGRGWCSCC